MRINELATFHRSAARRDGERHRRQFAHSRLILAAILGGIIGLERELKHRLLVCARTCSSASAQPCSRCFPTRLAGVPSDAARIAAQIIPGIGFIGAGSILHTRGLTSGLTSAATLFVVASVGMAAGGGLYLTAIFATGLVLLALFLLWVTWRRHLISKLLLNSYEVTGTSVEEISNEVNRILEPHHRLMQNMCSGSTGQHVRLQFDVDGCNREQKQLLRQLKASTILLGSDICLGRVERE